ncbi:hypothetical protein D5086_029092 [Populus alba]|uniref:Uncharacterized protein n=2 Tax=Populus TaxID=3689 RepID=A0ACC4ASI0_POPAL|nr:hypothetical protein POTOM_051500 [Populus tomentosa]
MVTTQGGAIFATIVGFNQGLVPELEGAAGSMAETASPCNSYWPVLIAGAGGGAQRWKEELKLVLLSGGVCRSGNERVAGARLVMVRGEVGCLYCVCWGSKLICIPSPEVP